MADAFDIEIATPERLMAREKAIRAQIPAKDGFIGVLPDHAPLLSELGIGAMTYVTPEQKHFSLAIRGGFLEIYNNVVRVLVDIAELGTEINVSQAEEDLKKAQAESLNPALGVDIASALTAMLHAQARIDAAKKAAGNEE